MNILMSKIRINTKISHSLLTNHCDLTDLAYQANFVFRNKTLMLRILYFLVTIILMTLEIVKLIV